MCRNIKTLFNFDPPVTDEEVRAASVQFVRKISGFNKPSKANEASFLAAVDEVAGISKRLLRSLETTAPPKNREEEAARPRDSGLKGLRRKPFVTQPSEVPTPFRLRSGQGQLWQRKGGPSHPFAFRLQFRASLSTQASVLARAVRRPASDVVCRVRRLPPTFPLA